MYSNEIIRFLYEDKYLGRQIFDTLVTFGVIAVFDKRIAMNSE